MRPRDLGLAAGLAALFFVFRNGLQAGTDFVVDSVTEAVPPETDEFTRWDALIHDASRKWNVPWRWIKAVMWNESSLGRAASVARGLDDPSDVDGSKSSDGKSWGLMQVTLSTAQWLVPGTSVMDLNNPAISIDLGARYLRWLMDRPAAKKGGREWVIRGYNGGPGWAVTVAGPVATGVYYTRFVDHLDQILDLQPGDDAEIG